jgi:hypothetical protein
VLNPVQERCSTMRTLNNQIRKDKYMQLYKAIKILILTNGSTTWSGGEAIIDTEQRKCLSRVAEYTR